MSNSMQPSFDLTMVNSNNLELALNIRKFRTDVVKRMILLSLIIEKVKANYQSMLDEDFDDDEEEDEFEDEFGDEFDEDFEDDDDEDDFDEDYEDEEDEDEDEEDF